MSLVKFPFIMEFIRSFYDQRFIYFLLDYLKGMELFDVIREIGLLSVYESQFYIGSVILSIEYLHSLKIVYRDIKPENIMIDAKGYLKMIDMGTAKILDDRNSGHRTFTIIGTPHYIAPEIIKGKGYSFMADIWSIGIVLYEFMCGATPFGDDLEDPYDIYQVILQKDLAFPSFMKDKLSRKIMYQLLNKIPDLRIGGSYAALKAHPWFDTFDWDKLYSKGLQPPYFPPKSKMISDDQIKDQITKNKSIMTEITNDEKFKKNLRKEVLQSKKYKNFDEYFQD